MEAINTQGRNKVDSKVSLYKTNVKSITIKTKSVNPIPKEHYKEGAPSKMMLDEIVVY